MHMHGLNGQASQRLVLDSKQNHVVRACTSGMHGVVGRTSVLTEQR